MFALSETPIDAAALMLGLARHEAGACVAFEGRVRDSNEGRSVRRLDYQAYAPLAATRTRCTGETAESNSLNVAITDSSRSKFGGARGPNGAPS